MFRRVFGSHRNNKILKPADYFSVGIVNRPVLQQWRETIAIIRLNYAFSRLYICNKLAPVSTPSS